MAKEKMNFRYYYMTTNQACLFQEIKKHGSMAYEDVVEFYFPLTTYKNRALARRRLKEMHEVRNIIDIKDGKMTVTAKGEEVLKKYLARHGKPDPANQVIVGPRTKKGFERIRPTKVKVKPAPKPEPDPVVESSVTVRSMYQIRKDFTELMNGSPSMYLESVNPEPVEALKRDIKKLHGLFEEARPHVLLDPKQEHFENPMWSVKAALYCATWVFTHLEAAAKWLDENGAVEVAQWWWYQRILCPPFEEVQILSGTNRFNGHGMVELPAVKKTVRIRIPKLVGRLDRMLTNDQVHLHNILREERIHLQQAVSEERRREIEKLKNESERVTQERAERQEAIRKMEKAIFKGMETRLNNYKDTIKKEYVMTELLNAIEEARRNT